MNGPKSGFSIVELMVTSLIVSLALVPIITVFSSGARQAAFDEFHVAAQGIGLSLIERTIEELQLGGFKAVLRKQTGDPRSGFSPKAFTYELNASPVDGGGWLWQITVNLSWKLPTDPPGAQHSLFLERLVSRPDVCFTGKYPYRRMVDPGL